MHARSEPRVCTKHILVATTRHLVETLVDSSPTLVDTLPKLVDARSIATYKIVKFSVCLVHTLTFQPYFLLYHY